ncbi:MAG: putative bifunctional diguanylate cyclase/phosphodiesterase [Acholeplasmatales bacterium]
MKKKSFQISIIAASIFLVFLIFFSLGLRTFFKNFFTDYISKQNLRVNKNISNYLSTRLDGDYSEFEIYLTESDNETLNGQNVKIYNDYYLGFGNITSNGLVFEDGVEVTFKTNLKSLFANQSINIGAKSDFFDGTFTDNEVNIYFIKDNRFGYFSAEDYLEGIIGKRNFSLVKNDGLVLYNSMSESEFTNLGGYFKKSENIVDDFSNGLDYYKVADSIDGKLFVTYSKVIGVPNLYYMDAISYDDFMFSFSVIHRVLIIVTISSTIVMIMISFSAAHFLTLAYRDLELSAHAFSYNTIPIVIINQKGKIHFRNKIYKKLLPEHKKTKNITDILETTMEKILRLAPMKAWLRDISPNLLGVRIFPTKTTMHSYTLLMYPFTEQDDPDEGEVRINAKTNLPGLHKFRYDVDELFKSEIPLVDANMIVAVKIVNLQMIDMMKGGIFIDELVYRTSEKLAKLVKKANLALIYQSYDNSFVLLYRNIDTNSALRDIRRILEDFKKETLLEEFKINIRAGIYEFNTRLERSSAIIMYEKAKFACDDNIRTSNTLYGIYDNTLDMQLRKQIQVTKDLEEGIRKNEFALHYQAQYDAKTEKVVGFEALLRWNNPKYADVSPIEYIEIAEKSAIILKIGDLVLEQAIETAKKLEKEKITISINISPNQLMQVGFVNKVKNYLEKYEVDASQIVLEITETVVITSFYDVISKLNELRSLGIKIQIDDFGTNNASLRYLKDLPIDGFKIDRMFVKDLNVDRHSKAIILMLLNLAKNLDLDVVVEGIENIGDYEYLTKRGARYIQGYYISKPVKLDEAVKLLNIKVRKRTEG